MDNEDQDYDPYVSDLKKRPEGAYKLAPSTSTTNQALQKTRYDRQSKEATMSVGDNSYS